MAGSNVHNNAEEYINKLYDHTQDKQKQLLTDAYTGHTEALDTQKQDMQQQTNEYLQRTDVEAQRVAQAYKPANVSDSINPQAALSMENQQKKNTAALRGEQQAADAEVERLRKLYADQFSAAIKQAQADNDMARAQMLYEAAKAKESELKAFSSQMGTLDNEALINQIYDSAIESGKQGLEMERAERMSELAAMQEAQRRETDKNLTQAYVDALRGSKNYSEVQNAYGLGSGNMAQAQLARDADLTEHLTELRRLQMGADAQIGQQQIAAGKSYADAVADLVKSNEQQRAEALYREALTQKPKRTVSGGRGGNGGDSGGGSEPDTTDYKVVNQNNKDGVRVGSGGMSWAQLEAAVAAGTVQEVIDHENQTISYVPVKIQEEKTGTATNKSSGGRNYVENTVNQVR